MRTEFKERKKEFIEKLRSNPQVLQMLTSGEGSVRTSDEMIEVLIDPKDERELKIAESIYNTSNDVITLMYNIICGNVKEIPLEENVGLKLYIDLINIVKEDGDINIVKPNMKENARQIYDLLVGMMSDPDEAIEYIVEQTGFDMENPVDEARFKLCIKKVDKAGKVSVQVPDDFTDEQIEETLEFSNEFHRLCEEGYTEDKENLNDMDDDLFSFFMKP